MESAPRTIPAESKPKLIFEAARRHRATPDFSVLIHDHQGPSATKRWHDEATIRKNSVEEFSHFHHILNQNRLPGVSRSLSKTAELAGCCLVAGDGFGGFFFGLVGGAVSVAVRMAVPIAIAGMARRAEARPYAGARRCGRDGDGLNRVGKIRGNSLR